MSFGEWRGERLKVNPAYIRESTRRFLVFLGNTRRAEAP
jgi:hypothetical protein